MTQTNENEGGNVLLNSNVNHPISLNADRILNQVNDNKDNIQVKVNVSIPKTINNEVNKTQLNTNERKYNQNQLTNGDETSKQNDVDFINDNNSFPNKPKKPRKPRRKTNQLDKLLEDSIWYMELAGSSNNARESSLKIEKIKEQKIEELIKESNNAEDEQENEAESTPEKIAAKKLASERRREATKLAHMRKKMKIEQRKIKIKEAHTERKRLIAEGNYIPKYELKKQAKNQTPLNLDITYEDISSSKTFYNGGQVAQLLKSSVFFTNQGGKPFDGTRREVKPVNRLEHDEDYIKSTIRRIGNSKKLNSKTNNVVDKKGKKRKNSGRSQSIPSDYYEYEENDNVTNQNYEEDNYNDYYKDEETEKKPSPELTPEPKLEQIWFTNMSNDEVVNIPPEWKFFQNFIYQNQNDSTLPNKIINAADMIRHKIKLYKTDHEVYKFQKANLHYPFSEYREEYLLAIPKDEMYYNPFDEIGKMMELMTILFFPDDQKNKVMNLDEPENCIVGRYTAAFGNNDIDLILKCIEEFNELIDSLRNNGKILEYTRKRETLPKFAVYELLNQCYLRSVLPDSKKLSCYKAFSNEVYGELMPTFLTTVYNKCGLNHKNVFIDLGSGVGNCVIQAALEFGCESYGVEIVENASILGDMQVEEFATRCRIFGLNPGFAKLFSKQSFIDNPPVKEIVDKCNVILVNNYLFDSVLNKKVIELFQDLQIGTKIISLKPIVPASHKINWNNCTSILNRLKTSKFIYGENSVSWTSKGGFYYITEVMTDILDDNLVVFKSRNSRRRDEGLDERSRSDTPLNAFTNNV